MKKIAIMSLFLSTLFSGVMAQDNDYKRPAQIGISFTMHDFQTASKIRSSSLSSVLRNKEWSDIKDMDPGLGVHYFKGLTNHVDLAGTFGFSFANYTPATGTLATTDATLLELDASALFKMTTEKYWVQPYLSAGVGGFKFGSYYGAFVPLGVGLKVNFFNEADLFINSQYRIPITKETGAYHFYHGIGVAGNIGKAKPAKIVPVEIPQVTDRDGDGILDNVDKCPDVKGLEKYEGCPIPDTDKDGINDEEDKCVDVPGIAKYQGCPIPDTDKDGINDEEDKCPEVAGVARYQGCPIPDTDGDGINDEEDKCPAVAGVAEQNGCPAISAEVQKRIEYAAKHVYFASGSYKLLSKSYKSLNEVVKIMAENPDLKLDISGHTDNTGDAGKNQILSENRAASVKAYLASKSVDAAHLTSAGYGQDQPVADNNTAAGKQLNRRVELKIGY